MTTRDDVRMERLLGGLLGIGVTISSACLAAGLVLSLMQVRPDLTNLFLAVGLIVLLLTPTARVVASAVVYVIQRDWVFAALTTVVFLELTVSLVAALLFNRTL